MTKHRQEAKTKRETTAIGEMNCRRSTKEAQAKKSIRKQKRRKQMLRETKVEGSKGGTPGTRGGNPKEDSRKVKKKKRRIKTNLQTARNNTQTNGKPRKT